MLKFLLLVVLFSYLMYKVGAFLFKIIMLGSTQNHKHPKPSPKRPADSNLNIDFMPDKPEKKKDGFKGGEYVDYEEV